MACDEFKTWLNSKLKQLKIDESVFGAYIISILEEEDEKYTALEGLFEELMVCLDFYFLVDRMLPDFG
jgi:hypothetical protein